MNRYTKYIAEIAASLGNGHLRLRLVYCNSCMRRTPFLVSGTESRSIRCLRCRSTAISLATLAQIQRLPLDPNTSRVYELSYHGAVHRHLKRRFAHFECSEYFGPPAGGAYVNDIRNEDVQRLSFASETFDLVSSTEVFEHVPDYLAGFAQVRRVLRPAGWFVFTVPYFDAQQTKPVAALKADGTLAWHGTPEYHDSQVTGVASVPVFWHHAKRQLPQDLMQVGFSHAELVSTHAYSDRIAQHVVVAQR